MDRLGKEFTTQKTMLDNLMTSYKSKQVELDQIRASAAGESKRLAVELGKAQSEANVLIMELKKFEGISGFLGLEKELILRAMEDSKSVDPALAARGVEEADSRRLQIENEVTVLQEEWASVLENVRQESLRVLNEDEYKEFRTRIATLQLELEAKTAEINRVQQQKTEIETTVEQDLNKHVDLKD